MKNRSLGCVELVGISMLMRRKHPRTFFKIHLFLPDFVRSGRFSPATRVVCCNCYSRPRHLRYIMNTNIHSLPTEIIQAIFVLACARCTITIPPDFTAVPWKLTKICSRWRTIAIDTVEIWSTIEFTSIGSSKVALKSTLGSNCLIEPRVIP